MITEDWGYLWGTRPLHSIAQLLKGRVGANLADRAHFLALLCETPAEELVGGLFDYKTPAYSTWNKADWLCPQCLEKFVRDHLHIWYLGQKVKRKPLPLITFRDAHSLDLPRRRRDSKQLLVRI